MRKWIELFIQVSCIFLHSSSLFETILSYTNDVISIDMNVNMRKVEEFWPTTSKSGNQFNETR